MSDAESDLEQALAEITEPTPKAEVRRVLDQLPDAFTLCDLDEILDEREHLRRGIRSALNEPLASQEEVEAWVEEWARQEPATSNDVTQAHDSDSLHESADTASEQEVSIMKNEVLEVLAELPDACTVEEILQTLYVRSQIKLGIWSVENEPTLTQEEVENSLSRWLND